MQFIKLNGAYVRIRITPFELENIGKMKINRKGNEIQMNVFERRPFLVVTKLCEIYGVKFKITRGEVDGTKHLKLVIEGLDIKLDAYGRSYRVALRRLA